MTDVQGYELLVKDTVRLISLPDIYLRVRVVLNNPDSTTLDLAEILLADPGLTARLLKIANSPFYGFRTKVETVSRAVALLGARQVHDVVLATSVARTFQNLDSKVMNMAQFWRDSVYCALLSRLLAKRCNVLDSERLFVHGLLRDVGHLLMYQKIPEQTALARTEAEDEGLMLSFAEQRMLGFDYTQVGSELMRIWDMPKALQTSLRWQEDPVGTDEYFLEASILHLTGLLTSMLDSADNSEIYALPFVDDALKVTRMDLERLLDLTVEAKAYLEEACSLLLPQNGFSEQPARSS